jgi:hypothetical protein
VKSGADPAPRGFYPADAAALARRAAEVAKGQLKMVIRRFHRAGEVRPETAIR